MTYAVLEALSQRFAGFEAGPVEMYQDPDLNPSEERKPRLWLPYEGPPLAELWITRWVPLDRERSSIELTKRCATCGTEQFDLHGAESWTSDWDERHEKLLRTRMPRVAGQGIYVDESDLGGASIFRIHEFPGWAFTTDEVRDLVVDEGFTNVSFLEMGDTV